ncbi:MAG TPA: hypothetical protein PKA88_36730 [Polyangiaceae bacterium]|nr:hypothetical protein [Polyangiaceae bacterium]
MSGQALSQSYWAVNDDGSTTVASNNGTGNDSYKFEKNVQAQYDQTLEIVITDSDGDEVETIVWDTTTVVTITIGPGQSVAIQDPQDGDSKSGKGTYQKV